jgi:hypothetical protein
VKVTGERGTFVPQQSVCDPILDELADHRPRTVAQIETALRVKGVVPSPLFVQVILSMIETGDVFPVQDEAVIRSAKKQTDKLNAFLGERARHHSSVTALASPVIGAPMTEPDRVMMMFCLAFRQGRKQPADLVAFAAKTFGSTGMTLLDAEKPYVAPDVNQIAVTQSATHFIERVMPILRALQVI